MAATQTRAAGAQDPRIPDGLLEHLRGLQPLWEELDELIPRWHPRNEGDADDDAADDDDDADDDAADDDDAKGEPDWKALARKHERRSKAATKRAEAAEAAQAARDAENQSDHEKAITKAKADAKAEALTEHEKERRSDRLEGAVIRLAAKGVKVKVGDEDKTLKFSDPEDAVVFIERAINKGDLVAEDVFDDDGKVQTDAVIEALAELLQSKPGLADSGAAPARGSGSADGGKGEPGKDASADPDSHFKAIRRHK
jgi:hypothetical protein